MRKIIEIESLSLTIDKTEILKDFSLRVEERSKTALVGPNGAGKTSLLKCILGLYPSSSNIYIDGERLETISAKNRAVKMAYVPQAVSALPSISAAEFLRLSRYAHSNLFSFVDGETDFIISSSLDKVGLSSSDDKLITTFSLGERQRLLLASALCQDAEILLLDEPTAYLDPSSEELVFSILDELSKSGRTILFVSHDVNRAALFADRIVAIKNGALCFSGTVSDFMTEESLSSVYGSSFCLLAHPRRGIPMMVPR